MSRFNDTRRSKRRSFSPHKKRQGEPSYTKRHEEPPSPKLLANILSRGQIQLTPEQLDQLWRYHNLLRERNDDRDLTRITGFYPMALKHYIDSMIIGNFTELPSPIVDVGTGAGFPGIPLKIRYPHLKMILAEPRPRRVEFLKEAIRLLKLSNITVFDHKVSSRSFTTPVNAVVTRALETMDKTFLRTSAAVGLGGKYYFLKGPNIQEDIALVENRFPGHFKLVQKKHYFLPNSSHERYLLVYEKVKELESDPKQELETDVEEEISLN